QLGAALVAVPLGSAGLNDLWAGAPRGPDGGFVRAYGAPSLSAAAALTLSSSGGAFGSAFAVGDFSLQGATLVAVGAPEEAGTGAVHVFDSAGNPFPLGSGGTSGSRYGFALLSVPPVPYLAIAAPGSASVDSSIDVVWQTGGMHTASVSLDAGMELGFSMTAWNAFGTGDLVAAGAPGAGLVFLFDPATLSEVASLPDMGRPTGERFASAVEGRGDVTGDGIPDLVVGSDTYLGTGAIYIFAGSRPDGGNSIDGGNGIDG